MPLPAPQRRANRRTHHERIDGFSWRLVDTATGMSLMNRAFTTDAAM
jgi:hypothetical protein